MRESLSWSWVASDAANPAFQVSATMPLTLLSETTFSTTGTGTLAATASSAMAKPRSALASAAKTAASSSSPLALSA